VRARPETLRRLQHQPRTCPSRSPTTTTSAGGAALLRHVHAAQGRTEVEEESRREEARGARRPEAARERRFCSLAFPLLSTSGARPLPIAARILPHLVVAGDTSAAQRNQNDLFLSLQVCPHAQGRPADATGRDRPLKKLRPLIGHLHSSGEHAGRAPRGQRGGCALAWGMKRVSTSRSGTIRRPSSCMAS
jgi:hypothetical protein